MDDVKNPVHGPGSSPVTSFSITSVPCAFGGKPVLSNCQGSLPDPHHDSKSHRKDLPAAAKSRGYPTRASGAYYPAPRISDEQKMVPTADE